MKLISCSFFFLIKVLFFSSTALSLPPVKLTYSESQTNLVEISNGFVFLSFDLIRPQINFLKGDFEGTNNYGPNIFSNGNDPLKFYRQGIVLECDIKENGNFKSFSSSKQASPNLTVNVLSNTSSLVQIQISSVLDDVDVPHINSTWTISLATGKRNFDLLVYIESLVSRSDIVDVRLSAYSSPSSIYAWFSKGVVQMKDHPLAYFPSTSSLVRVYNLGSTPQSSLDITPQSTSGAFKTILMNARSENGFFRSGIQFVLVGDFGVYDSWVTQDWSKAKLSSIKKGDVWILSFSIGANNYDFPVNDVAPSSISDVQIDHIRAIYTSIYGSSVGALDTYQFPGQNGVTLFAPTQGYGGNFNFFDPDSYFSTSSLMYSGIPYLQNQIKTVIERSQSFMLVTGQIPHHFANSTPTYVSLCGANQTGPNLFWLSSALIYVENSGDYEWLKSNIASLELAMSYLEKMYSSNFQLIFSPGSLYIDVFIRNQFTSDSNAYLFRVLRWLADAEVFLGNHQKAGYYNNLASNLYQGMQKHLWVNDHFITQRNMDGTIRDFVDFDANTIAIAFGLATKDQALKILNRIDKDFCSHVRPTYVSEVYYDKNNCYDKNIGDSNTTMGRIGWTDGLARKILGQADEFYKYIFNPILNDLFKGTWITERYNCDGNQIRTSYYHEYPEMLVLLLREAIYGIKISFQNVTIDPWTIQTFSYYIGNVNVFYSQIYVSLQLPGDGMKAFLITGLLGNTLYNIKSTNLNTNKTYEQQSMTSSVGNLQFMFESGLEWKTEISHSN